MKTINCAECNVEVTYEENPRFPRKYCVKCSAQKKASFEANHKEAKDFGSEEVKPEVVKIPSKEDLNIEYTRKPRDNGFALTIGNVRSNALASDLEYLKPDKVSIEQVLREAKIFEKYILTGK